jgi:hypothetical protein
MRRLSFIYSLLALSVAFVSSGILNSAQAAQPKEWTFLVFLNGNNSLDSFGPVNLKQMEKIGSTANVNIVVQWASLSTHKVSRLLIQKSTDASSVTSPIVQSLPSSTDMGDYNSVVDFVKWGAQNYPAKHYFLDIWDHGSGWHDKKGTFGPKEISLDENTGHMITTQQLGIALTASAQALGQKVDVYASDACLMAMAEIANEMSDSVSVYAGSEDVEPGAGWPYDTFLARLVAKPLASPSEVATMLSQEYAKLYSASSEAVTFSAFDLSKLPAFKESVKAFADNLRSMSSADAKKYMAAAKKAQKFTNSDYADFLDFLTNINATGGISASSQSLVQSMVTASKSLIVTSNNVQFPKATGLSIWLPQSSSTLREYASKYSQLKFDGETHWSDFLTAMLK